MKITFTKMASILLIMHFMAGVCSGEEAKGIYKNNIAIYNSVKVENKKKLSIAGVDLSKYGFDEVYRYSIIDENTLFVWGKMKENSLELIQINKNDISKKNVARYPIDVRFPINDANIIMYSQQKQNVSRLFVMFTYWEDLSGNRTDYETTTIEIYRNENNGEFKLINKEQIEEANICYSISFTSMEGEDGYYANLCNPDMEDLDRSENYDWPARRIINRIYLNDVNNDGFLDILIWRKITRSKLKKEAKDNQDYVFDSERLYVMYFDPETMSFRKRLPLDWE